MRFYVTYAKPIITCSVCQLKAEAGLMDIQEWCTSIDDIHRVMGFRMPNIPVGWSSNGWSHGNRDLRCVKCTKGESK